MNIADALAATPVSSLDLARYVAVPADSSVAATVRTMADAGQSCACVVAGDERLAGIFTQRDVLMRVIGRPAIWERPVAEEMTTAVRTMANSQFASDGLSIMNDWWVRSVPVLDGNDKLLGNLSYYVVMQLIADLMSARVAGANAEPDVQHTLSLVDFAGLHTSTPVTVRADDTVAIAAHHMKARAIGSVLVVDQREHLIGVLTESDLLMKVGCEQPEPSTVAVGDIMTPEPVALGARSPIVEAIQRMAEREFSHVPLLGSSGRPVGVASFRDIAAYLETSLAALG